MELHYEEGNTLRSIIISHQPGEKHNLTAVKALSLSGRISACVYAGLGSRGKRLMNDWQKKKTPRIKKLTLILLASKARRAGVALFSSLSEIAECVFFNTGNKPQACTLKLKLTGWILLAGFRVNAFVSVWLTFSGSGRSQTQSKSQLYPLCFSCIGM